MTDRRWSEIDGNGSAIGLCMVASSVVLQCLLLWCPACYLGWCLIISIRVVIVVGLGFIMQWHH